jgi:hypothetical protein
MIKKAIQVIGTLCITTIIVLLVFWVLFGSEYAIRKVESFMNQQLDADIDVQKISFNIWQPELKLHNVQINSKDKTPLAGCQALNLSIPFSSFWSDTIQISHLQLIRPWLFFPVEDNQPMTFQQVLPYFSVINQLMKKRIFSIKQAQRKKTIFLQSLDLFDGALYFSRTANEKSFRLKHFMINATNDNLHISGLLSHANEYSSERHILKFETSGKYSDDDLAQSVIMLLSSQSYEIFYDRFLHIVNNLRSQSSGHIQFSNTLFQQIGYTKNKISGNIVGTFELDAFSDSPIMKISIGFAGDHIANIPITELLFRANVEERLVTINEITMTTRDSQVNIQGIVDLNKLFTHNFLKPDKNWENITWHFIVDSKNFPLSHFHPAIPTCSKFNGQIKLKGQGLDLSSFQSEIIVNGHADLPNNFCLNPKTPLKYNISAYAESDMLTVRSLSAQTEGMVLTANGRVNLQKIGNLSMNTIISGKWLSVFGLPELTPDFHTTLTMHRSLSETNAHIQLWGNQLALNQYQLGDLNIDASLSIPGKITINKASLSHNSSELETKGYVDWKNISKFGASFPDNYDISIHSNDIQLNDFHPGLSGIIKLDGNLMGSEQKASGQFGLDGQLLHIFGQHIKSVHFPIDISFDGIQMRSGIIQMDENEQMNIDFALDTDKNYQVKIDSNPISLSRLKGCIPDIQGKFKVDITGKGNIDHPHVDGNILVAPILFQNKPLPDAMFNISTLQDMLKINCQSMLDFQAQYNLKNGYLDMRAQAKKMQLAPVIACFGLSQFNGQVSGVFQIAGQLQNILNARGQLQIDHAALTYNNLPLAWMDNFDLIIDNKELTVSNYMIHFSDGGFCKGAVYGKFPDQTHLKINSIIPLDVMRNLTDNFSDIAGVLRVDGTLYKFLYAPMFEGQIRITDGEFVAAWNNQRFHNIQGQIDTKDHIFALKNFSFGVDDGNCVLKGKIVVNKNQLTHVDLKGSASAIPISIPDIADFMVNARMNYSRQNQHSQLTGNLEFLEGLYYHNLSVNQMLLEKLQQKRRPDMVDQICRFYPPICSTSLDINIQSRIPLIADNDLAYMEIHPDLSIRGTLYNPVILGRTEMLNGEINYLGKTFVLEKGVIDFVNPYRTEPMIDIESNVAIRDWQISLDVLGKPDELQVKLSSTPAEEHADIISILLFGKPTDRLFVQDTGPYKSTQQMIAELLSSTFEDDIKNTTGLDTFRLEAYEHETVDDNQNDDYKITLGKELSRRMSVTYAFETRKGQLIHHTQANYKILENLIFRGMQDTQGTYGGELLLHLEFRQLPGF